MKKKINEKEKLRKLLGHLKIKQTRSVSPCKTQMRVSNVIATFVCRYNVNEPREI